MSVHEERAATIGSDPQMVGIVTRPAGDDRPRSMTGVVLLGAGLVHHVGPNRLMVRLARRNAEKIDATEKGCPSVRGALSPMPR